MCTLCFYKNLFYKCGAEKSPKGEELLFWILHKIEEMICFSAYVRQCNYMYTNSAVLVQLCFKPGFVLLYHFLVTRVSDN